MGGPGGLATVLETVSNEVRGNLGTTRKNSRGGIRDYRGTPDSNEVCQQLRRSKGAKFAKFKVRRGSEVRGTTWLPIGIKLRQVPGGGQASL